MKHQFKLSTVFLVALLGMPQKVLSDFGPADVGGKNNEARTFEAWCGSRGNTCKVDFGRDSLIIDGANSVNYVSIRNFHYDANKGTCNAYGFWCIGRAYTFDIIYTKSNGEEGVGKIIFAKEKVALSFMHNLKSATGNKPWAGDPRCEQGQIYQEGICLSPVNAAEVRIREKESVNASEAIKAHGRAIGAGLAVQGELQKEGLQSAGESIGDGLRSRKVQQNTNIIVVPR